MQPPIKPNEQQTTSGRSGAMPPVTPGEGYQPGSTGPYEDTGYAPELRAERSENLYRRDERFWEQMPGLEDTMRGRPRHDTYFSHPEQFQATRRSKPRGRRGSHVIPLVLGVAVLLMAAIILFASPLFSLQEIRVVGNTSVSSEEIIARSGLKEGMNRFALNAEEVMRRVESNYYLICELVHMPEWNTVEIRVREREVVAVIDYNGLMYYADNRGMILEEFANRASLPMDDKILVVGLNVRRCDIGRTIMLTSSEQLNIYNEILVELKVMGALGRISELDMSSMESIFLTTRDGYSVRLGNSADVHRKLRAMLLTLDALRQGGYGPGTIDVSAPINPTYIPDEDGKAA